MSDGKDTIVFDDDYYSEHDAETIHEHSANETIGLTMLDELFDAETQAETRIEVDTSDVETFSIGKPQISTHTQQLGRYNYEDALGEGAYGTVWRAQDIDIGRSVAIKSYKFTGNVGEKLLRMETNIAGKIDHPGVPVLYDVKKTEDGQYHFIMKYIEGETLEAIITRLRDGDEKTHQQYGQEKRAELILQILRVLISAHKQNIIHRDIKAENIMVGLAGEAYLMDWGIAINTQKNKGKGQLAGTPRYMSPEQAAQKDLDQRTDLYSLCAVMYEFMSLKIHGPDTVDVQELLKLLPDFHLKMSAMMPHPRHGGIPIQFQSVIMKGLQNSPDERFQSATDMMFSLEQAVSGNVEVSCPFTLTLRVTRLIEQALSNHPIIAMAGFATIFISMIYGMFSLVMLAF